MTQRQSRRRRARRRRKHGFSTWSLGKKILLVFVIALLLMITVGVVYAADKLGKLEQTKLDTKKLSISDEIDLGDGYTNLALFGLDSRDGELGEGVRSDSIIIASLNNKTKEIKMVSLYRDTLLELEDGSLNKANSAYAFGGPEEAVAMINKNLDLNIEDYIAVNFNALVDVIDALGGMDVTLSDAEVVHMNNYCVETSEVTGKSYTKIEPESCRNVSPEWSAGDIVRTYPLHSRRRF
ncbi:MAG: LCP family protein [Faecalimonas umbilicata]